MTASSQSMLEARRAIREEILARYLADPDRQFDELNTLLADKYAEIAVEVINASPVLVMHCRKQAR